jgi:NAD(P)-dependent dehydrogenase (short-subunit alcohol dehydrogenase family)
MDSFRLSKQAITLYTRQLAASVAAKGIRANSVSPGAVSTPILAHFYASLNASLLDDVRTRIGRHGEPGGHRRRRRRRGPAGPARSTSRP